jgi:hypothetical protein
MLGEQRLAADGLDARSQLWKDLPAAIANKHRWAQFELDAQALGAQNALAWIASNRQLMAHQWSIRDPERPHSIGGLEIVLRKLVHRLDDRRFVFRNRARLELVFDLMGLEMAGLASERRFREIIRKELLGNGGRPIRKRRSLDDHGSSSLHDAIRQVNARLSAKRAYNSKAQAASQARRKAAGKPRLRKPPKAVTKGRRKSP